HRGGAGAAVRAGALARAVRAAGGRQPPPRGVPAVRRGVRRRVRGQRGAVHERPDAVGLRGGDGGADLLGRVRGLRRAGVTGSIECARTPGPRWRSVATRSSLESFTTRVDRERRSPEGKTAWLRTRPTMRA